MKKIRNYIVICILGFLILGNPTEYRYLVRLQEDYGSIHQGNTLSIQDLNRIGESAFRSYLFWGFYNYSFGTIQVSYFGIAFMTFYIGSSTQLDAKVNPEKIIT
ncbi:MAG: hypothetical protein AAGC64_06860 [Bacteroidota bacterium]